MKVVDEIAAERDRQIHAEGFTLAHDDRHSSGEIAVAAAVYTLLAADWDPPSTQEDLLDRMWPWEPAWLKCKTARQNLIRAAALIVAEIERLDRM